MNTIVSTLRQSRRGLCSENPDRYMAAGVSAGDCIRAADLIEDLIEALEQIEMLSCNGGGWCENDPWRWGQDMGNVARAVLAKARA